MHDVYRKTTYSAVYRVSEFQRLPILNEEIVLEPGTNCSFSSTCIASRAIIAFLLDCQLEKKATSKIFHTSFSLENENNSRASLSERADSKLPARLHRGAVRAPHRQHAPVALRRTPAVVQQEDPPLDLPPARSLQRSRARKGLRKIWQEEVSPEVCNASSNLK